MKNLITRIALFMLKFFGVTLDDLVAYSNNQPAGEILPEQDPSSRTKLPLEVLYDGGYRSFFIEKDKTPIAIICGDFGVAFEDAPEEMNWYSAKAFCEKYSVGGKEWSLPNHKAGHLELIYNNKEAINKVLTAFGKDPLTKSLYWASEYSKEGAFNMDLSDGSVNYGTKGHYLNYVRPVTLL